MRWIKRHGALQTRERFVETILVAQNEAQLIKHVYGIGQVRKHSPVMLCCFR